MPDTTTTAPHVRLHLPADHVRQYLLPLTRWGDWCDWCDHDSASFQAWRSLRPHGTPRSWARAHAPKLADSGLTGDDVALLLASLHCILEGARRRHQAPDLHSSVLMPLALQDELRTEAGKAIRLLEALIDRLELDRELLVVPTADPSAVYQLVRALLPFVDADHWERQLLPYEDGRDPDAGTWACRAGIRAKLHAEAVVARYSADLDADPAADPIPGVAEDWTRPAAQVVPEQPQVLRPVELSQQPAALVLLTDHQATPANDADLDELRSAPYRDEAVARFVEQATELGLVGFESPPDDTERAICRATGHPSDTPISCTRDGCGWSGTHAELEHHLQESLCPDCRIVLVNRGQLRLPVQSSPTGLRVIDYGGGGRVVALASDATITCSRCEWSGAASQLVRTDGVTVCPACGVRNGVPDLTDAPLTRGAALDRLQAGIPAESHRGMRCTQCQILIDHDDALGGYCTEACLVAGAEAGDPVARQVLDRVVDCHR